MKATSDPVESIEPADSEEAEAPRVLAAPITNRFLFVDVAALRAKQLRRGSVPRVRREVDIPVDEQLTAEATEVGTTPPPRARVLKLERVAMEEVARGLIQYDLPAQKVPSK